MYPIKRGRPSVYFPTGRSSSPTFTEFHGQGGLHPEDAVPGWNDTSGLRSGRPSAGGFRCPFGGSGAKAEGQPHPLPWRSRSKPPLAWAGHASQAWERRQVYRQRRSPHTRRALCRHDLGPAPKTCVQYRHRGLQPLRRICQGHRLYRGPGRHRPDPGSPAPERTGNTDSAIARATDQSAAGRVAAFRWQGFQANSIPLARKPGKPHGLSGGARSFRIDQIGMVCPTPRTGFSGQ